MTIENDIRLSRLDKTKEAATHANEELDWPNLNKYREDNKKLAEILKKNEHELKKKLSYFIQVNFADEKQKSYIYVH